MYLSSPIRIHSTSVAVLCSSILLSLCNGAVEESYMGQLFAKLFAKV